MFTFDWSFWFLRFLCKTNFSLFSEILKSWIISFWSWVCVNIWRRYSWGFFSYKFRSSENICGRHLLFVGLSLFGLCLFFGDSGCWLNRHCIWFFLCWLTAMDWTCKSMCILYQKKHKKITKFSAIQNKPNN